MNQFSDSQFSDLYQRVKELRLKDIAPYAKHFQRSHTLCEVNEIFEDAGDFGNQPKHLEICGRVMSIKDHMNGVLIWIEDQNARLQLVLMPENISKASIALLKTSVYRGDYLGFSLNGVSRMLGAMSGMVTAWRFLSIANLPIPITMDFQRQQDERHLYWASSLNARERFVNRSRMISKIRHFLHSCSILEVNTPFFNENETPSKTEKNALQSFLVGGIDQVYEIRPSRKSEPIDWQHHPQALSLYCSMALKTPSDAMQLIEQLVIEVTKYLHSTDTVLVAPFERLNAPADTEVESVFGNASELEVDLSQHWICRTVPELIFDILGFDFRVIATLEEAKDVVIRNGLCLAVSTDWQTPQDVMVTIFNHLVTPMLIQPTFVLFPTENERSSQYFELIINGIQMGSGYSEITDPMPIVLEENFSDKLRRALMVGMPPATSFSLHIDRLALLMLGAMDVRDVICFPTP